MPVTAGQEQSTFGAVSSDITAAAVDGGAITSAGLPGTFDHAAFVAPKLSDMETIDSSDSCVGLNILLKPSPTPAALPSCECMDNFRGRPAWDQAAASYTNLTCTVDTAAPVQAPTPQPSSAPSPFPTMLPSPWRENQCTTDEFTQLPRCNVAGGTLVHSGYLSYPGDEYVNFAFAYYDIDGRSARAHVFPSPLRRGASPLPCSPLALALTRRVTKLHV